MQLIGASSPHVAVCCFCGGSACTRAQNLGVQVGQPRPGSRRRPVHFWVTGRLRTVSAKNGEIRRSGFRGLGNFLRADGRACGPESPGSEGNRRFFVESRGPANVWLRGLRLRFQRIAHSWTSGSLAGGPPGGLRRAKSGLLPRAHRLRFQSISPCLQRREAVPKLSWSGTKSPIFSFYAARHRLSFS